MKAPPRSENVHSLLTQKAHSLTSQNDVGTPSTDLSSGLSSEDIAGEVAGQIAGQMSEHLSMMDPYEVARLYPENWAKFIWEVFRNNVALVMHHFRVSEKTVRNWINAKGAVNVRHSTVAELTFPNEYREIVLLEVA